MVQVGKKTRTMQEFAASAATELISEPSVSIFRIQTDRLGFQEYGSQLVLTACPKP